METKIFHKNNLLYSTDKLFIDWYEVIKNLIKLLNKDDSLIEPLDNGDLFEYQMKSTILGKKIDWWINHYDLKIIKLK